MEYDLKKAAERMTTRRRLIIRQKGSQVEGLTKLEPEKEPREKSSKTATVKEM